MSLVLQFSKVRCYGHEIIVCDNLYYNCQVSSRLVFLERNVNDPLLLSSTLFKGIKVSYPRNKSGTAQQVFEWGGGGGGGLKWTFGSLSFI